MEKQIKMFVFVDDAHTGNRIEDIKVQEFMQVLLILPQAGIIIGTVSDDAMRERISRIDGVRSTLIEDAA